LHVIIGIDCSTTGSKAVAFAADGTGVAEARRRYDRSSPAPGWQEEDPDDWWTATRTALHELWARGHSAADVACVGLSGQMHSLVLLGEAGDLLAPAILWSDQRTVAECEEITDRIGASK